MKQYTAKELEKMLRGKGYDYIRTRGSHRIFKRDDKTVVVPIHLNAAIAHRLVKENGLAV